MDMPANPVLLTADEITRLQREHGRDSLMGNTIASSIAELEAFMARGLDVPGHGEAGSYEHNRHKDNYKYIDLAGQLFLITGDARYGQFAADLLSGYADKYLKLGFQVQRNTNPPGRLFHQIMNEHMWLLFASLGYSCISHWLSDEKRRHIIENLFEPMLEMFTVKYHFDFDRIHNHGLWAVAGVGVCGLAIGQEKYLDMAIDGLKGDREAGGFLAQISQLFAPSGYYIEGPYYHRFAIHPLCLFAEVVHRHRPALDIFNFKDRVIQKTVQAMLATAYPNGCFPALNDASLTMSVTDAGVQVAVSQYFSRYGADENLLGIAKLAGQVWLHPCGLQLSEVYERAEQQGEIPAPFWPSVELNEGRYGDCGAQGFLRTRSDSGEIYQVVMNYGQHGMGHGHFDTLGTTYFNRMQEVLREYGFARWVNVESKFGGRYLDENKSYARQTIAHNAVTIDEQCQNNFDVKRADAVHGTPHFFLGDSDAAVQGMSALANEHYDGFNMQRSQVLLKSQFLENPLLVDLFKLDSVDGQVHQYDYAHQYQGQIIRTNVAYHSYTELRPLGDNFGYQHLWNLAQGPAGDAPLVSWLQGNSYYSWIGCSSNGDDDEVIFTRVGANDPQFNLRPDTSFILRSRGKDTLFASALETHGYFNEAIEASTDARGRIEHIRVLDYNDTGSVIEIGGSDFVITVMVSNLPEVTAQTEHCLELNGLEYRWTGCLAVREERLDA